MGRIIILDEDTANKIAAGEVIERPASVVKELLENSIDAGASVITVEIAKGGVSLIRVVDNGSGIAEDDVRNAFERHATSKISNAESLNYIKTLGFRGEALSSIASVAKVEISTKTADSEYGIRLVIEAGRVKETGRTGCPEGTSITVRELFYNTPARYKFLKKDSTEARYVTDVVNRIALSNPHISIRYFSDSTEILHTPGNNDLLSVIYCIYGKQTADKCLKLHGESGIIKVEGFVGHPSVARSNRAAQSFFVNGRYVKSPLFNSAVDEAFKTFIMKGRHPFAVINVSISFELVDVNVHPTKLQVRFHNEQEVFRSIYHAIRDALQNAPSIEEADILKNNLREAYEAPAFEQGYKEGLHEQSAGFGQSSGFTSERSAKKVPDYAYKRLYNGLAAASKEELSEYSKKELPVYSKEELPVYAREEKHFEEVPLYNKTGKFQDEREILQNAVVIGQIFKTFLLLQHGNKLYIVDQHASHEKVTYEKLKKEYESRKNLSQQLVSPVVIELGNSELQYLEEKKELFHELGYIYDIFGNNSIIVRSVPYVSLDGGIRSEFLLLLEHMMEVDTGGRTDMLADEALYRIACSSAVKAGSSMGESEAIHLIEELARLDNPFTCPHGRPTVISIDKEEFEKRFKRK